MKDYMFIKNKYKNSIYKFDCISSMGDRYSVGERDWLQNLGVLFLAVVNTVIYLIFLLRISEKRHFKTGVKGLIHLRWKSLCMSLFLNCYKKTYLLNLMHFQGEMVQFFPKKQGAE